MYHFKETENATGAVALDDHIELSGCTIRYLKEFQISAVRFLYEHFSKREFCILNDESGLGKTAIAAVLLGIVGTGKNCLIVVANEDERINDWRFHLDILTDLNVNVIDAEKDYDETASQIYIAKWNTLRVIGDLSKMKFDIVVLDNREQMLKNTFCISTLLKNFEKKVQLVISSVDVTSDVKFLHNILRLGGRLGHQLESFKAFEQKFHLPDQKAISNKKSDLEEYFLKREILNDYCREFRLRRYRHQYEHMLPLVDPTRYKAHLAHWIETVHVKKKPIAISKSESILTENGTEDLFQQFDNNQQIDEEVQQMTNDILTNGTQNIHNSRTDANEDEMNMSPLLYLSESDSDADVIVLSSNSIETVIPIIEIEDGDGDNDKDKNGNNLVDLQESILKEPSSVHKSQCNNNAIMKKEEEEKYKNKPERKTKELKISKTKSRRSKELLKLERNNKITRLELRKNNKTTIETTKSKTTRSGKNRETSNVDNKKKTTRKKSLNEENIIIKNEKTTPKKSPKEKKAQAAEKANSSETLNPLIATPQTSKLSNQSTKSFKATPNSVESATNSKEKEITPKEQNGKPPPISRNATPRRLYKRAIAPTIGVPQRETRNMQRTTRSSGNKRKCFALEFDDDKKSKAKATPKKSPASSKIVNKECKEIIKNLKANVNPKNSLKQQTTTKSSKSETKKTPSTTTERLHSTQGNVLPASSDYEEIQCGQKLIFESSGDNSPALLEKPNEFLMPSTPPSIRSTQYTSLLQKRNTTHTTLLDCDSDIALLSNSNQNAQETVILLSSSHDEASLSSQASTEKQTVRKMEKQQRKRYSKRMTVKHPLSFGNALAKDRSVAAKSPDLFSIGSDIGSSNAIPFTQIHCTTLTTPTTNATFGFKIFGSEVKRLQDINASNESSSQRQPPRAGRSCLNILEQMFEKRNNTLTTAQMPNDKAKHSKITTTTLLTRKRSNVVPIVESEQMQNALTKTLVTPRKPIHERNRQTQQQHTEIISDDIFEITNNATFGSTLRINASGNISPVQQLNNSQHHNKITNYLTKHSASAVDDQQLLFGTPSKRTATIQQQSGSSCTVVPQTRKSPKSIKSTQTTKLTKWFRRSSVDNAIKATKESLKDSKATKTTKRRRLDLSFQS